MSLKSPLVVVGFALVFSACGSGKNDCDTVKASMERIQSIQAEVNRLERSGSRDISAYNAQLDALESELPKIEPFAGKTLDCGDGTGVKVRDQNFINMARGGISQARTLIAAQYQKGSATQRSGSKSSVDEQTSSALPVIQPARVIDKDIVLGEGENTFTFQKPDSTIQFLKECQTKFEGSRYAMSFGLQAKVYQAAINFAECELVADKSGQLQCLQQIDEAKNGLKDIVDAASSEVKAALKTKDLSTIQTAVTSQLADAKAVLEHLDTAPYMKATSIHRVLSKTVELYEKTFADLEKQ